MRMITVYTKTTNDLAAENKRLKARLLNKSRELKYVQAKYKKLLEKYEYLKDECADLLAENKELEDLAFYQDREISYLQEQVEALEYKLGIRWW